MSGTEGIPVVHCREEVNTLNEVVPASTVHFAVEDARRALHQLLTSAATIRTSDARRAAGEGS